jgi:hypothetical protein
MIKMNKFKLNQIRRKILEFLYFQSRKCASYVKIEFLLKNSPRIDKIDLLNQIDYLKMEGYIKSKQIDDGFINIDKITITSKGTHLIENEDILNSKFPVE